jgi:hypothetical protein
VDKDLRASLVAACAAAALSALVGIIAGVGFFDLLLRALLGGALLGTAVFGGIIVLRKAVPGILGGDLESEAEAPPMSVADPEIGSHVDIVLPGEAVEVEELEAEAEPLAAKIFPEGEADSGFAPEAGLLEPEGAEDEAETAIPASSGARASPGAGARASAIADAERERRSPSGFDELDVLPDLDGFTDSFTASEFAFGGSSAERPERSPGTGSGGGSAGSKAGQEGMDPAALAQAVRTILKRDQKG